MSVEEQQKQMIVAVISHYREMRKRLSLGFVIHNFNEMAVRDDVPKDIADAIRKAIQNPEMEITFTPINHEKTDKDNKEQKSLQNPNDRAGARESEE